MVPPAGDGSSPAPIDRLILEFLQTRLRATRQIEQAIITDANGYLELHVRFASPYSPPTVDEATLLVRWYTNDDFKIHYREVHPDQAWECRWDRHPNPHNTRDHFHPPPTAPTAGENTSWPTDHRDVLRLVLSEIEDRITTLWNGDES
ncbi:hypothetical protein [Halegenticoccus soli]|uniref:hypothetical protein n=1 Tax=Halegenticoccus soli TaxID=1985678 RepID=UPI000C6E5503